MEIVSVFLLFIEIFVSVVGSSKWFTGVHILSEESLFWRLPVCIFGSVHWFTGVLFCFNGYNLEGRNGFSTVLLMNSDQLYMPKFS